MTAKSTCLVPALSKMALVYDSWKLETALLLKDISSFFYVGTTEAPESPTGDSGKGCW